MRLDKEQVSEKRRDGTIGFYQCRGRFTGLVVFMTGEEHLDKDLSNNWASIILWYKTFNYGSLVPYAVLLMLNCLFNLFGFYFRKGDVTIKTEKLYEFYLNIKSCG
ncbi:hypothetical protein BpHYR1_021245 [Brachionus plicatilis]|uniref:Uncharacterized protein n=1 Tax=Brachionus plicatilis TaxID=10195 RepID=A0A3M7T588_BRAPC|nr:hypothetical protein BpHYR1_021245 [Brachionus plicatilis]